MQPRDNQRRRWKGAQTLSGRTITVLAIAGVISLVGAAFRLACVGRSCEEAETIAADVPFCRLPDTTRALVSAGFRDGRSPNILTVARESIAGLTGSEVSGAVPWPRIDAAPTLPLVFSGSGVAPGAPIPDGVTLDRVAPTVAEVIGLERPHPEVRSGTVLEGIASGDHPGLVVMIVMKGVGSSEADQMKSVSALADTGSATFTARAGSSPMDPAAMMTTIGTGGLPRQHGIIGSLLRNDSGSLVEAWGRRSPVSVIAALGDDLDELTDQAAEIGLVAGDPTDQGLVGGNWYINNDRDDLAIVPAPRAPAEVERLLDRGYGENDTPDLIGVTLEGAPAAIDDAVTKIVAKVEAVSAEPAFVVTATGPYERSASFSAAEIERIVESRVADSVIEASTPGGFFVDQAVLADEGIPEDEIVAALADQERDGTKVFADVFAAIAVTFERYC